MRTFAVNIHALGSPPETNTVSAMFTRQRSVLFLFHNALKDHVQSRSINVPSSMKDESFITSFDGIAAARPASERKAPPTAAAIQKRCG